MLSGRVWGQNLISKKVRFNLLGPCVRHRKFQLFLPQIVTAKDYLCWDILRNVVVILNGMWKIKLISPYKRVLYNIKGHYAVSNPDAWTIVIQVISEIKNIVSTVDIPIVRYCFISSHRNSTILKNWRTLFSQKLFLRHASQILPDSVSFLNLNVNLIHLSFILGSKIETPIFTKGANETDR